jgi:hypothetical protein
VLSKLDSANQVLFNGSLSCASNCKRFMGMVTTTWAMLALNQAMIGWRSTLTSFDATFNGSPLSNSDITGAGVGATSHMCRSIIFIHNTPDYSAQTVGRLYCRAVLNVDRLRGGCKTIGFGMRIDRAYCNSA